MGGSLSGQQRRGVSSPLSGHATDVTVRLRSADPNTLYCRRERVVGRAEKGAGQSSIASIPSSANSAIRSRIFRISSGGGGLRPTISSITRSGSVVR